MKLYIKVCFFVAITIASILSMEAAFRAFRLSPSSDYLTTSIEGREQVTKEYVDYFVRNPGELKRRLDRDNETINAMHHSVRAAFEVSSKRARFDLLFWAINGICVAVIFTSLVRGRKVVGQIEERGLGSE